MKFLNTFVLILVLIFPLFSGAQSAKNPGATQETGGTVNFTVTTVTQNGTYAPRHVLAIWIEQNTQFVKTRVAYANARKQYLYTWKAKSNYNVTDAITGPTRTSHGTVTATWDCRDLNGNILPDGEYVLWIEFTEKHAQGPLYSIPFTKGTSPQTITPPDQANFKNMTLTYTPVTANFNADQTTVCVNENVVFTSTSTGATSHSWNFGSGAVPQTANTVGPHTVHYTSSGAKTVSLTVNGSVVETKENFINVTAAPVSSFTSIVSDYTATFSNTSTNAGTYVWDFGDGNTSASANPTHTYSSAGNYTVSLSASNTTCDAAVATQILHIPVIADFTADAQDVCMGDNVVFTSTSVNASTYLWNFGGGAVPATASTMGPHTVTYNYPGPKNISLTINGNVTVNKNAFVTVYQNPSASYTFNIDGMTVSFTNTSQNATNYAWDFGDGNTSTELNPVHTYTVSGSYEVLLSASNTACEASTALSTIAVTNVGFADNPEAPAVSVIRTGQLLTVSVPAGVELVAEIYDLNGRILYTDHSKSVLVFDLAGLVKGMYILKAGSGEHIRNYKFLVE